MGLVNLRAFAGCLTEQANQLIRNELFNASARERRCGRWQVHCKQDVVGT